jgi:EpsI family protein
MEFKLNRFVITITLIIIAISANYGFSIPEAEQARLSLERFPLNIGPWTAVKDHEIDETVIAQLLVDDYIMRTYTNSGGDTIGLYIGYFMSQREGKQVHSPRQCLPGSGWTILKKEIYRIKLKNHDPAEASINLYVMQKGNHKELFLWWYHSRGRIYANEYLNKLYLIWDAITKQRTDGALVRLNMPINDSVKNVLKTEIDFCNYLFAQLPDFIPN